MSLQSLLGKTAGGMGDGMLKMMLNHVAKEYGSVEEVMIDRKEKTARLRIVLRGETEPVTFHAGHYTVLTEPDGQVAIRLSELSCDREWMAAVLRKYVEDKPFPLPAKQKELLVGFLS
ncbi:MAG: hypothetical protein RRC34_06510 [Lentisphaeria bacterium]|nr:hypothetical protein [Lentisphaeria bacterium]